MITLTENEEDCSMIPEVVGQLAPAKAVITWTADALTPPVSVARESTLQALLARKDASADRDEVGLDGGTPPSLGAMWPSHCLLVTLKKMLWLHPDPANRLIEHTISDITLIVRSFYRQLTAARFVRGSLDGLEKVTTSGLLTSGSHGS